jgi:hypothetical protein
MLIPEENIVERVQPTDQGAAEPPATEETQPAAGEEDPVPACPEGQVLNEESGLCVLEEPEAIEEPEPAEEAEEQSTEEETDNSDNSNN